MGKNVTRMWLTILCVIVGLMPPVLYLVLGKRTWCQGWYMVTMVGALIFTWCIATVAELLFKFGFISRKTTGGWTYCALSFAWNVQMALCPWIVTTKTDRFHTNFDLLEKEQSASRATNPAESRQPGNIVLLSNHTSYLDTPQFTRLVPWSILWRSRGYAGSFLFKAPLFGRILQTIGHFAVYFKSMEDGKFSVDKDKMAIVEESVDQFLADDGVLCLFPEGSINKTPESGCSPFRYGTFHKALQHNFRLWGYTSVNHDKCWGAKAKMGGNPANMKVDLWPLAPDGVHQLLKVIRADNLVENCNDKEDHVVLAEYSQAIMEKNIKELRGNMPCTDKRD